MSVAIEFRQFYLSVAKVLYGLFKNAQQNSRKLQKTAHLIWLLSIWLPTLSVSGAVPQPNPIDPFLDHNTNLNITSFSKTNVCPGETFEVCVLLTQKCGGNSQVPLANRPVLFFINTGCGVSVGQESQDTAFTDAAGNACIILNAPAVADTYSVRAKFVGEEQPDPCPNPGNNACNPTDPDANRRCIGLSASNACEPFAVTLASCPCPTLVVTCPANIQQNTDGSQCEATVSFSATTQGGCGAVNVACTPPSGSKFPVGATPVKCVASDASNNKDSCEFTVAINDRELPTISCPANINKSNDPGECGANVDYSASANDNCPDVVLSCTPPSGGTFSLGTANVKCVASDASGNKDSCQFTVTITDTEPPSITCSPDITVNTGPSVTGVNKSYTVTASDRCSNATVVCNPPSGSLFPIGSTTVNCTAADAAGNASSCSFSITVNSLLLFQGKGEGGGDEYGFTVAGGGDVNADGVNDFVVGAPGADPNGLVDAGSAFVYSGKDGSMLYQFNGSQSGERLGGSAGMTDDANGDGNDDFIVGAPGADPNGLVDAGSAYVYSGTDGNLLHQFNGSQEGDRLGGSAGASADIDGDGNDDYIVGAPGADPNGLVDAGSAYVYSGDDGNLLYQVYGSQSGERLGGSAGLTDDFNGDSFGDFIAGAPEADPNGLVDAGSAFVYSGKDGNLLYEVNGSQEGERLGGSAGASADIDGDGNDDFILGAPGADASSLGEGNALIDAGSAFVYSGADGSLLYQVNGTQAGERLGGSAGMADDANGDGNDDFIVGAPGADINGLSDAGAVFVYSGADGSMLFEKNGTGESDRLGGSAGMFESGENGSGPTWFIIGAPGADANGQADAGSAYVYQILFKGDLNGDGALTPADVVLLLNCIFLGVGVCPIPVADLDCDGVLVNPSDAVILLNAVFLGLPITCSSL